MDQTIFSRINLYTLIKDIFKNLWVIILAAIMGFMGVRAYYNFTYKPVYSSSMIISVNAINSGAYSYSNLNKTIEAAGTFQEMFQSSYFKEKLTDMTGITIDGTITTTQVSETNLITISYTCSTPINAYKVLKATFDNYNIVADFSFDNMIINMVTAPSVPVSPSNAISYNNYDKIASAGLAGAVLIIICLLSFFRDTVKNEGDVERVLDTKLFVSLAHEEKNKTLKSKLHFAHSKDPLMVTNSLIDYSFSESFRKASIKLEYLMSTKKIKTLMISSCGENEGKSTVAVNLALTSAMLGKKVLLVDGDLRKPAVHKFFKNVVDDDCKGIGAVIRGNATINEAIKYDSSTGLFLICGKQKYRNSSEMLSTKRFSKFVEAVEEQFDLIIFDSSPISLVADAEIIASEVDAALIVVRQDIAPIPEINDMIDMLGNANTNVIGCIFNDVHYLPFGIGETKNDYGEYGNKTADSNI